MVYSKSNKIKILLGKRIQELRKAKGLSQQALAELVEIDQRNLSHIERGDTFPSRCIGEIAEALNVELTELFDFKHLTLSTDVMSDFIKTNIEKLSPHNIQIVYKLIKTMN